MKIEKINENRIKCTLNKSDLDARQISIKELASGSSKAQKLINEVIETAGREVDFHINNEPIMVEAAQLPDGEIHFYISKGGASPLLNHDDNSKSTFTITTSEETLHSNIPTQAPSIEEAKEAINHFFEFAKKQVLGSFNEKKPLSEDELEDMIPQPAQLPEVLTRAFIFRSKKEVIVSLDSLKKVYEGNISVYENPNSGSFYVVIYGVPAFADEFNKTCNLLTEYGAQLKLQCSNESYYREHYELLFQGGISEFTLN